MDQQFEWTVDESGCHNLNVYGIHVWIEARPWYCDRGHYIAKTFFVGEITGLPDLDAADAFPRYYMKLERAQEELAEWLAWRLKRLEDSNPAEFSALKGRSGA